MKLNKHGLPVLDSPQKRSRPKVERDLFCRINGCNERASADYDGLCFQHLMNMDSQSYSSGLWKS